ncbi:MAG: hypothetical protein WC773_03405 [Patescibacteria group bacterium]|jgi:hypothetical protein
MTGDQFLIISGYFLIVFIAAFCLGTLAAQFIRYVLKRFKINLNSDDSPTFYGVNLMVGMGLLSNLWLVLGLLGWFTRPVILSSLILVVFLFIGIYWKRIPRRFTIKPVDLRHLSYIHLVLIGIATYFLLTFYAAAMLPPHLWDELSYHLPEAGNIVQHHRIFPHFEAYLFFGNIPKLMEVLYAGAISLSGTTAVGALAHLMHFTVILGLLMLVYQWLRHRFGTRTAAIGLIMLVLCDQLMQNGIIGYIDAATAAFEVAAVIMAIEWIISKNTYALSLSMLLIGFGLASKYSASPSFLAVLALLAGGLFRFKLPQVQIKKLAVWLILLFVFACGYWYIKNIYFYGNPFYPLYFGHRFISDSEYLEILASVRQISDRSLSGIIEIVTNFLTPANFNVFWAIILFPIALLVRKSRSITAILVVYAASYFAYWYFFASRQDRFMIAAIVAATILIAILLGSIRYRWSIPIVAVFLIMSYFLINHHANGVVEYRKALKEKRNQVGVQYVLGQVSTRQYMSSLFGCAYLTFDDMKINGWNGNVIDNWTVWHDPNVGFFATNIGLVQFNAPLGTTDAQLNEMVHKQSLKFLYFNQGTKERFAQETNTGMVEYRQGRAEVEARLLQNATLISQQGPCMLYKLNY